MGTEAVWVPLVAAALAGGATYVNSRNTARKQDANLAADIRSSAAKQREATGEVNRTIEETRASNPEADKAASLRNYLQQLAVAKPQADQSFAAVTGASDAYKGDAADAALGVEQYGKDTAGLMSRIDAPTQQRLRESNKRDNLQAAIDRIKRFAEGDHAISQIKLQGIRRNPLLDAFASAAQGYGSAVASGGSVNPFASGAVPTAPAGWLGANTPAMAGLTGADNWLQSVLGGRR